VVLLVNIHEKVVLYT